MTKVIDEVNYAGNVSASLTSIMSSRGEFVEGISDPNDPNGYGSRLRFRNQNQHESERTTKSGTNIPMRWQTSETKLFEPVAQQYGVHRRGSDWR